MSKLSSIILQKIIDADPKTYIIFFTKDCGYSMRALNELRKNNVAYKGYNIYDVYGKMNGLLKALTEIKDHVEFDATHTTRPIIFRNGKFIGGSDALLKILSEK